MAQRNDSFAYPLEHITADEVPDVMRATLVRNSIAKVVAQNSGPDACTILDTTPDVVEAIREYAKPR